MIATGDEIILVHVGAKEPNKFVHWHYYIYNRAVSRFLDTLRYKGLGYGYAYYYSHGKIWFRKEKHLTMYLLIVG